MTLTECLANFSPVPTHPRGCTDAERALLDYLRGLRWAGPHTRRPDRLVDLVDSAGTQCATFNGELETLWRAMMEEKTNDEL